MAAMSEEDLRSALKFEASELIPIPIDEALLDFQILDHFNERTEDGEERAMMRILLVAAQRDMVRGLLAALEGAGLRPSIVDVVPFALLRALASVPTDLISDDGPAEAIVCIGGGVTNVVVHENGVPRFVRMLIVGGDSITDAISGALGVDVDTAEDLKRRAEVGSADPLEAQAGRIVADQLVPVLDEIRGSLDYYLAQSGAAPISRILLTGGGSRLLQLGDRLHDLVGLPVEEGHPLLGVHVGKTGIAEEQLIDAEPLIAVPIGLALAARPTDDGRRRMTLLPREIAEIREQRRIAQIVVAAVVILAVALIGLWYTQGSKVSKAKEQAKTFETESAKLQTEIGNLSDAKALDQELVRRRQLALAALSDDVAWTRLFQQIATVIPNDVWLTSFSGSKQSAQQTTGAKTGAVMGQVSITAKGFDHTSAARWLLRVGELPSISNLWLASSSRSAGANSLVTFQSTAILTAEAKSDRASRLTEPSP
jgi:type IV pilus assembly protein PilM